MISFYRVMLERGYVTVSRPSVRPCPNQVKPRQGMFFT